jgi:hypothetical protein
LSSTDTPIGRGFAFAGSSDYISIPNASEFDVSAVTIEFLIKTDRNVNDFLSLFIQQNGLSDRAFYASINNGGLSWYGPDNIWAINNTASADSDNEWHAFAGRAQNETSASLNIDTTFEGTEALAGGEVLSGDSADIIIGDNFISDSFYISEVRYSNVMRSIDWVKTTNNLNINNNTVWSIDKPIINTVSGSTTVSPTVTTTYYLTIINCCGQVLAQVTVTVGVVVSINTLRDVMRGVARGVLRGVM